MGDHEAPQLNLSVRQFQKFPRAMTMKTGNIFLGLFVFFGVLSNPGLVFGKEVSLFDSEGNAVAYIDTEDNMAIYLWKGKPVAYIDGDSIYGFNGKHLGWFERGIIFDHNGCAVGFIEGAVNKPTKLEKLKGLKQLQPLKSLKQFEPLKPLNKNYFSSVPLEIFLYMGIK